MRMLGNQGPSSFRYKRNVNFNGTSMTQTGTSQDSGSQVAEEPPPRPGTASGLSIRVILAILLLAVGTILAAVLLFRATGRDWWVLLRDPATAYSFPAYAGLFSHLGVLAMTAAGAISVFVALCTPRRPQSALLAAGLFTLWLAADDLFLLHEGLLPRLVGLPEPAVLGLYLLVGLAILWRTGAEAFSSRARGLWVSAGFLAVMVVTDLAVSLPTSSTFLLEETAKFCGFLLWSAFWIAEARAALAERLA
jgi:hypothetical protein